jgi:hypothetical protein
MSEGSTEEELTHTAVVGALTLLFETVKNLELQATASVDERNLDRQIWQLHDIVNQVYEIVKFNPILLKNKKLTLVEQDKMEKFNEYFDDYLDLLELIKEIKNSPTGVTWKIFKSSWVPEYESRINAFLQKKVPGLTWKELRYHHRCLFSFLFRSMMKFAYELKAQVDITMVQTLPRDEIVRLTRSIQATRRETRWE